MKKRALLMSVIVAFGFSCVRQALPFSGASMTESEKPVYKAIYNNLQEKQSESPYIYNVHTDLITGRDNLSHFKTLEGKEIKFTPEVVQIKEIKEKIFDKIYSDANYDKSYQGNTLAGLKFIYGYDDIANKFVILYEPVIFSRKEEKKYKIEKLKDNTMYVSNESGKLINLTNSSSPYKISDTAKLIHNYRGPDYKVLINNKPFNNSVSLETGDIKCCYMTLQQIRLMYSKAKSNEEIDYSDNLSFWFVANKYRSTPTNPQLLIKNGSLADSLMTNKLHIVVYYDKPNIFQVRKTQNRTALEGSDDGADFSGMNPPYADEEILIGN